MRNLPRRSFIKTLSILTAGGAFLQEVKAQAKEKKRAIKPIEGSWFEFQHHNEPEGKYWDQTLMNFSSDQWDQKIREISQAGISYLVLLDVAIHGKSFYPSRLLPMHKMKSPDPLETILSAADRHGVNFFVSNGFFGDWTNPVLLMKDPGINSLRLKAMNEVAEKYASHKSFYGWYYPNETGINGHYQDYFINYVNISSAEARKITPGAKTLIAPYGTRNVKPDDKFVRQLEQLDVDFIAYQDEIGVEKTSVEESAGFFSQLSDLHKKAARSKLWADVEIFRFEGKVYQSALIPASSERVIKQLEAVSPYVEKIFIYQYTGMLNRPSTGVFAGHPDSTGLYEQLAKKGFLKA